MRCRFSFSERFIFPQISFYSHFIFIWFLFVVEKNRRIYELRVLKPDFVTINYKEARNLVPLFFIIENSSWRIVVVMFIFTAAVICHYRPEKVAENYVTTLT